MDKHIETLEELVQEWRTEAQNYVRDNYDEHGVGAIALKSCANQLDAAIALMRGQSEDVSCGKVRPTLDMSGRLHFDVAAAVRNGQFADEIEGARMLGKRLRKPITKGLLQRARDLFEDSRTFARERGDKAHATQCTKDMNAIDAVLLPSPPKDTADEQ